MPKEPDYNVSFYLLVLIVVLVISVTIVSVRLKSIDTSLDDIKLQIYQIRQAVQIFNARLWLEVDDTVDFAIPEPEDQIQEGSKQ